MKEEIIIDGVNVAKCEYYYRCDCKIDDDTDINLCKWHDDCYYKQLKRLEQENENLKKEVKQIGSAFIKKGDYARELEQKYEQLRSALEEILESAKFAQCLPCGSGNLEDCLNCSDETTNNGQFCMEKRIHEIKTKCVEVLE